ncbi:protein DETOXIFICATION 14-like isoform X2 [Phalaenopsis equestris]|uniref:protein DETOXIFICATION 14-like isoform X2 n=1 Tax=Phalaenopsis equestris TaxID=78828 RepID=UPI0009E478C2|nr:protein DETOXIFICATION 14-like isoform X2 [Phalaenopsis equestris]
MEEGLLAKEEREVTTGLEFREEGGRLGRVAVPMVIVSVAQYMINVISTMLVGHLGELPLAGASIAASLTSVTGFTILIGMASALETLCGQAYGAQQYQKLVIHTCSAIFSLTLVSLPISIIWLSMGKLLLFIGQDPKISEEAGKFAVWTIPAIFAYAASQPLMKFLQSQSVILPMLLSSIATLCFHIPVSWYLIFKSGLGIVGAALSISISYWMNTVMLVLYIFHSTTFKKMSLPLSKEAFKGIKQFFRFACPTAIMICLEYWSFEMLILLSGLLPKPKLETSVLSICLTTISLLYNIPYGLGASASTRISNELGAANPKRARLAVHVVMFIIVMEAIIMSVTLFSMRYILGYAYSNEEEVADYVKDMVPLVCLTVFMDSLQGVLSGVARGCGWQNIGKGLWIGLLCGSTAQTILLSFVTILTNWERQVERARERLYKETVTLVNNYK